MRPFFLRLRVWSCFLATWLLNLGAFGSQWTLKSGCNPGMNCHGCPWAAGACPIGVFTYGSAIRTLPVFALSLTLAFGAVLGRLACAFLCPFGLLQDLLFKIPFYKTKLPVFTRYGKYLALALLVVLFPLWLGFEQSGFLRADTPKAAKAVAESGKESEAEDKLDVVVTVANLGQKPVVKPQVDLIYADKAGKEISRTHHEFAAVTVAAGKTVALPAVRIPNKQKDAQLTATSPQSEVEQSSPYELYYCRLCPVGTLEATLPSYFSGGGGGIYGIGGGTVLRIGILAFFLVLMLLVSRPFCRIFCPLGAIYGLLNRFALARIGLDKSKCAHCGACNYVCPVDLNVPQEVGGAECIACGDCAKVCPKKGIERRFGF